MLTEGERPAQKLVVLEIWDDYRPYFKALVVDALIAGTAWLALFGFVAETKALPVDTLAGRFAEGFHAMGAAGAFLLLAVLFVNDLWNLRKGRK